MARPKKKTVDYFPHMCISGKTLFILEQEYQNDGYSLWFKLLEELGKTPGHCINFNDVQFQRFFAAKTHINVAKTHEILSLCAELDAIDKKLWENGLIWSQNFVVNIYEVAGLRRSEMPKKPCFGNKNNESNGLLQQKPQETGDNADLTTQRKLNEIKENKSIDTAEPPKPLEEVGSEAVIAAAKEAWDDQRWREQICLANYMKPEDMRQWMYAYNASLSNDVIDGFSPGKYKKMFNGWLQSQKQKGRTLPERPKSEISQLRKIN